MWPRLSLDTYYDIHSEQNCVLQLNPLKTRPPSYVPTPCRAHVLYASSWSLYHLVKTSENWKTNPESVNSQVTLGTYALHSVTWEIGLGDAITRGQPAHSAPPACSQNPVPGPAEALSQAGQRDTWPNRRNTSSCRLPDAHHGENSGQRRSTKHLFIEFEVV
ncbi:hypothetical protein JOB18_041703 [Solea senegalensis]|uniref:Uncharacterized protein n=1 Tax=Solea senegalensis TaxID=28829 RepID=A0AAV6TAX8_SOLSE|nr:hypothetical protein JOB18_041703 [Solea senegalensis]